MVWVEVTVKVSAIIYSVLEASVCNHVSSTPEKKSRMKTACTVSLPESQKHGFKWNDYFQMFML